MHLVYRKQFANREQKMINQQPKPSMDSFFTQNQSIFKKNEKTFNDTTDSGISETLSESVNSTGPILKQPKAENQTEDCCGDCNSLNCPHCDCSFW